MTITLSEWAKYRDTLKKLNQKAADEFRDYFLKRPGGIGEADRDEVISVAYSLATKYGEGSAALAAEFYDEIAAASGKALEAAIPAETMSYGEVAKAVNGTLKTTDNIDYFAGLVERLVKQPGADTMVQNAKRDKAEFAWIPFSKTCPFCITLASRGWQYASKDNVKKGHAEHIHGNCDCNYVVRFSPKDNVDGYNPEIYKRMYYDAEGKSPKAKINSMRREFYEENKEEINAQKRELYKVDKDV